MVSSIVGLMKVASFVICVIVIASFAFFVFDQTSTASQRQQNKVLASQDTPAARAAVLARSERAPEQESGVHEGIDDASQALTAPFSGIVSPSSGEWAVRGVELLLALAVYGFGLAFLARVLSVKV